MILPYVTGNVPSVRSLLQCLDRVYDMEMCNTTAREVRNIPAIPEKPSLVLRMCRRLLTEPNVPLLRLILLDR